MNKNGAIFYEGESKIDGGPIVGIITGLKVRPENKKTGNLLQTWIIRQDQSPWDAVMSGNDFSVCGSCQQSRGPGKTGKCYVDLGKAPHNIYDCYKKGRYPTFSSNQAMDILKEGRYLRIGAYGNPSAIPFEVWSPIVKLVKKWTGYEHLWRLCDQRFKEICVASCETEQDLIDAKNMGWYTFRSRFSNEPVREDEFMCPASEEANYKMTCYECMACGSGGIGKAKSPTIILHGNRVQKIEVRFSA